MKKKIIIACASLVAIIAVAIPSFSIGQSQNSLIQQNFSVIIIGEEPSSKICYQTMGYSCSSSGSITYKCTNSHTAEVCRTYVVGYNCCE